MIRTTAIACASLLALAAPAFAQGGAGTPAGSQAQSLDQHDQHFVDHAARDNQGEIRLCLLAEKKADNPAVKAFARLMVDDHIAIESQLASLLTEQQADASRGETKEDQQTMQELQSLRGHEFDVRFLDAQIKDHRNDVQTFEQEMGQTHNRQVWALTATTLPILRQHLELARAVDRAVDHGQQHADARR